MIAFSNISPMNDADGYIAQAISTAGKVPTEGGAARSIGHVAIVGAGTMGRGIALAFAQSGRHVVLIDINAGSLSSAEAQIRDLVERQVSSNRMSQEECDALFGRLKFSTEMADMTECDLAIEAVPEDPKIKATVLRAIEEHVSDKAVITSNTSTLDVDMLASALSHPERFIGTHFFLPAQRNKLLEIVPARVTAPDVLQTVMSLAADMGKQAVIAPNSDGFIGNRLFDRFHQEAMYLLEEGALPQEVDQTLEQWGFAIGPFRTLDLIGNDVPWLVRKARAARANPPVQPRIGDALCEAGYFGAKTGKGWYLYDAATPKGRAYEDVIALITMVSKALGIHRRRIEPTEILERILTALTIEAQILIAEGGIRHPTDIDMVYVTGYGFPKIYGGPVQMADTLGRDRLCKLAQHYGQISGRSHGAWRVPECIIAKEETA